MLEKVKQQIEAGHPGTAILAVTVDVRKEDSVQDMLKATISTFGRVDYCANVAGIIRFGDTTVLPTEDFDVVYEVNLRGVFLCSKAQISAMLQQETLTTE